MVEDGGEAGDHGEQCAAVLLDLDDGVDQTLGGGGVRQVRRGAQRVQALIAHLLQGNEHSLVVHARGLGEGGDRKRHNMIINNVIADL